ncbi:MAG: hypothetical protein DMG06_10205 [Acidobacteria bacterium]|nr:MAG: hypothetical protein DMG06_10205 [Acidobacteriota bacterium]
MRSAFDFFQPTSKSFSIICTAEGNSRALYSRGAKKATWATTLSQAKTDSDEAWFFVCLTLC